MTAQETASIVQAGYDAVNKQNGDPSSLDPVLTYFAEDCEKVDVPSNMTFRDPQGMKQWLLGFTTAFPDARVEITNLFATEDRAVVELIVRGAQTGPLRSPAGDLPLNSFGFGIPSTRWVSIIPHWPRVKVAVMECKVRRVEATRGGQCT